MKKTIKNEEGSILISIILVLTIVLGFSITLTSIVMVNSIRMQRSYQNIVAISSAEAAIEKTMWELNSGTAPTVCDPFCSFDNAEVTLSVSDIDGETKEISAEAFVPTVAGYKAKKKVRVRISATPDTFGVAFNYAIQAGAGGIVVGGSSEVQGNLYSNGNVSVSNPAEVEAPGNVWAVGTISDPSNRIAGTKTPGAPPVPLPQLDTQAWINLAKSGGTITGNYTPTSTGSFQDVGPKEITGNMNMSNTNQKLNLLGPLYIHGDLTISGGEWKIDDAMGTNGTVVLVDGKISISGSAKFTGNSFDTYILFASTNTANTSSNPAISFIGSADAQNAAFYAMVGAMKFSGSGEIIAMTGETLFLEGSGEIEYKSGLASANFAGGPGGVWKKKSWQQL